MIKGMDIDMINNEQVAFQEFMEKEDKRLSDRDLEKRYNEYLDEVYETVSICGYEYDASHALKMVDPTAYGVGFNDWLSSELDISIWEKDGDYFDSDPNAESKMIIKGGKMVKSTLEIKTRVSFKPLEV